MASLNDPAVRVVVPVAGRPVVAHDLPGVDRPAVHHLGGGRGEPYRLDDYYTNNLQPYTGPRLLTDGGAASVPTARQLFLDARFTSYHANVATVFLRYSF